MHCRDSGKGRVGEGVDLRISMPEEARPYILEKGYVAVDGMSLTVGLSLIHI